MKDQPRDRRSLHHPTRHSKNAVTMAIVTLLLIVGGTSAAIAQGTVLDRRVGTDHLGAPVVWLPESIGSGLFVRRVAWGAQVPLVFEAAPAPQVWGLPIQVDLTNLTVREALDALVAADSRYSWRVVGDTVVVRPSGAWDDDGHPLQRRARDISGDRAFADAFRRVAGDSPEPPAMVALSARVDAGRRVKATNDPSSLLTRLGELAAAGRFFVQVADSRVGSGPLLKVSTSDGYGYTVAGARHDDIQER